MIHTDLDQFGLLPRVIPINLAICNNPTGNMYFNDLIVKRAVIVSKYG